METKVSKSSKALGWIGVVCGVAGAILLSLNISISGYGYIFFVLSSTTLVVWAFKEKQKHQLMMQIIFTMINVLGIYKWLA